jgi:hypothetical protein
MAAAPGRCSLREDDQPCPGAAVYLVRFADCPGVVCVAQLWCAGHPACAWHTAGVRAARYQTMPPAAAWVRQQDLDAEHVTNGAREW